MKKVYIKYNPYRLTTEITIDGKSPAENSRFRDKMESSSPCRLQEWVEDIPDILLDEYNDSDFDVTFYGTVLDCEDLSETFQQAVAQHKLTYRLEHIPAKETADKEALIDEVFREISSENCPVPGICDPEMKAAFQQAKSDDFEVCVVATMSSGKSTLINAMLGTKLMPSKQEACTAIITRIKDTDDPIFRAEVYHKNDSLEGPPVETLQRLTYDHMSRWNSDEDVSTIQVYGKIPFMDAGEISLVLIDTPGPNNARDRSHLQVQQDFLGRSSKALVLYIMTGEFGTDDDNNLLRRIAGSMTVEGKKSRDRFLFVVNKMDDRKKEDGDVEQTLDRIRQYLDNHDIAQPNLFPVAALPAMNIRRMESGELKDEDELDEVDVKIRKLNRGLHLEEYAVLPPSMRNEIKKRLGAAEADWSERAVDNPKTALIHTGIVSVEAAIRQYVQKYAKTAKIKNISDTFRHKLDEQRYMEEVKKELASNQEKRESLLAEIADIRQKIDSAKEAQQFEVTVQNAVDTVNGDSESVVTDIITRFQSRVANRILALKNQELSPSAADKEVERLRSFAEKLEPEFEEELKEMIQDKLIATSEALLESYSEKLKSLSDNSGMKALNITIDPLKMMGGSISQEQFKASQFVQTRKVEDGQEYVKNTDKKWYKPWTWFQESGYYRTKYKTEKYISGDMMAQEFFRPLQEVLYENGDSAKEYAQDQSARIAENFKAEFARLDRVLKEKLSELERYASDASRAEDLIRETEKKLNWLKQIIEKVDSILEI